MNSWAFSNKFSLLLRVELSTSACNLLNFFFTLCNNWPVWIICSAGQRPGITITWPRSPQNLQNSWFEWSALFPNILALVIEMGMAISVHVWAIYIIRVDAQMVVGKCITLLYLLMVYNNNNDLNLSKSMIIIHCIKSYH